MKNLEFYECKKCLLFTQDYGHISFNKERTVSLISDNLEFRNFAFVDFSFREKKCERVF